MGCTVATSEHVTLNLPLQVLAYGLQLAVARVDPTVKPNHITMVNDYFNIYFDQTQL